MNSFLNYNQAFRKLKEEGVLWLTLTDVYSSKTGKETFIWECSNILDMSESGDTWKDAVFFDSPNGISLLEDALSLNSTNQIYFKNNLITSK